MEVQIVKLKGIIDNLLGWVRQDLLSNLSDPTNSWLYKEFNSVVLDGDNFYTHLRNMILLGKDDTRRLETRMMFSRDRANLPTLHIHYPSEDTRGGDNSINTGWYDYDKSEQTGYDKYSRSFIGQYEIIITGVNSVQVVMLYEFIDALLIAASDTLAYNFDKFDIAGKQLLTNPEIIPHLIFYRAVTISIQAKKNVRSITSHNFVNSNNLFFEGKMYFDELVEDINLVSLFSQAVSSESVTLTFDLSEGFVIIKWEDGVYEYFGSNGYSREYFFKLDPKEVEIFGYRQNSLTNVELV